MKANRTYLFLIVLLTVPLSVFAQKQYATTELQEMGQLLDKQRLSHIEHVDSETKVVTHLGLPLFKKDAEYPYNHICRFIERFTLYAQLLPPIERKLLLSDNKVKMDVAKVAAVDSTMNFTIDSDETTFNVSWSNCKMSFPKNFQLIMGVNKKESDMLFYRKLMNFCQTHQEYVDRRIPIAIPSDSASYIVENGDCYIIREVNSNRYYLNIGDDKRIPIYGEKYASESVVNLFQQLVNSSINIHISQNLYNYKRDNYTLPLSTFTQYCGAEGCRTYVGIEDENNDMVKAVIVYCNDFFAYNHLLYVEVDRKVLREQKGEINGVLYCYIPTHNLKNLFRNGKK